MPTGSKTFKAPSPHSCKITSLVRNPEVSAVRMFQTHVSASSLSVRLNLQRNAEQRRDSADTFHLHVLTSLTIKVRLTELITY